MEQENMPTEEERLMPSICGDFIIRGGWQLGPRRLSDYEIVYFPVGSETIYSVAERIYPLDRPCFVLTRPGETHRYLFDSKKPIRHMFSHFRLSNRAAEAYASIADFLPADGLAHVPNWLQHAIWVASTKRPRYRELMIAMLLAVLEELVAASNRHSLATDRRMPPQISQALTYIEAHYRQPISIMDLAENVGWSHEYLTRMFVQHQYLTPKQYILQRRIDHACELLRAGHAAVKEIAYESGFQSESYFSRVFTRLAGMSATAYRERHFEERYLALHLMPTGGVQAPYTLNRLY
ncbi:helix-turn-helix transcriptional regulator [Paenibacillus cymbidii]|uniref:helix-turn-helix transcriptional regulator n=1 Tax=Paenibacillus cymbidii TaxID=1639034 RepID=UPI001080C61C|nr:AraC family transcriptional regulator [Paenibacillus cymbidii]